MFKGLYRNWNEEQFWAYVDRFSLPRKKKIAKLIAEGIHGGSIAEAPVSNTSGTLYRVQVGAYSVKANAEAMLKKLKEAGFEGFIASSK
jgi:hypothetical protein